MNFISNKIKSPSLAEMIEKGDIAIVGAMYDVESGRVGFFEDDNSLSID